MPRIASVHAIDGPSQVERIRDGIVELIESGRLVPGDEMSISALAEKHSVRAVALMFAVSGSKENDLFTVQGDRIIVSPLPADSLRRALQMRRDIEGHILARSVDHWSSPKLRRLADSLPDPADLTMESLDLSKSLANLERRLHGPGGTGFDLHILDDIFRLGRRFVCLTNRGIASGLTGYDRPQATIRHNCVDISLETLSMIRSGNFPALQALRAHYQNDYEELTQLALELDFSRLPSAAALCDIRLDPPRQEATILELRPRRHSG
jgi:DNA-binding GntR family transcriptional regulator